MSYEDLGTLLLKAKRQKAGAVKGRNFSNLNDTILKILVYHLPKVTLSLVPCRTPGKEDTQLLCIDYGDFHFTIPMDVLEIIASENTLREIRKKMNQNMTQIVVWVKDIEKGEKLHDLQVPSKYEPFLMERTSFKYHSAKGWGWYTHLTVPAYSPFKKRDVLGDIAPGVRIFEEVPSEQEVISAILQSQESFVELVADHKNAAQAEWIERGFRSTPAMHKQYKIDRELFAQSHIVWEDQVSRNARNRLDASLTKKEVLVKRLGTLAKWLVAEYGEFDPENGWSFVEVPGYITSHRLVPSLPAMAIAAKQNGELVIDFRVGFWTSQWESVVNIPRIENPEKPGNPPLRIWEGEVEGQKKIGLLSCNPNLHLVSEWLHPELEFVFPGINQKAWELSNEDPDNLEPMYEVVWMSNPWPHIMRGQW